MKRASRVLGTGGCLLSELHGLQIKTNNYKHMNKEL